ncbi:MAG: type II toxin-antitoxin system RelE/ParE family toxin [Acidobacteria bacterium]|nr:type II toxin-antitoxin system RelE/ParE family toxin [Acidobacteriota bacterium]
MSWACELTEDAEKDLRDLPRNIQRRVARVLNQMATDPFQGDVKALRGDEWQGVFRHRIGSYRILFTADQQKQTVSVVRILIRSKETYR